MTFSWSIVDLSLLPSPQWESAITSLHQAVRRGSIRQIGRDVWLVYVVGGVSGRTVEVEAPS